MNILALEGEREFDITGETAPVYCFSLALCLKEWEDASYMYNSWRTYPGNSYVPMAGDVAPDGTMRVMTWASRLLRRSEHEGRNDKRHRQAAHGLCQCQRWHPSGT